VRRHAGQDSLLYRLAKEADILDEPAVRRLVRTAAVSQNPELQRQVAQAVLCKAVDAEAFPFPTDISGASDNAGVALGTTVTGDQYGVPEADLMKHLLVVGQSGAGKTTLFYHVMNQLEVPFWAFDLKQDYRHLVQERDELVVLPWQQLRFNPLQPPDGVSPRRWAQVFSEIFGHATALLSASKNYLMKQIIALYRLYDLFEEVSPPYPSLYELQLLMKRDNINYMRKAADYRDTVVNRLEAMTMTAGAVFDCSEGYTVEELLQRDVVFEFDGLGRDTQNFLMEILFAYVYEYRLAQNQRDDGLHHVFFLDEGKRVFSVYKERQDAAGIPAIDELTAKMREFGEGLVVADQEASKLTDSIKANTYTKLLLATGGQREFEEMAAAMQLSDRQAAVAQELDVGQAIVQRGGNEPIPVALDDFDLAKEVTDRDLHDTFGGWAGFDAAPRHPAPVVLSDDDPEEATSVEPVDDTDGGKEVELSADAERLLEDVVENPFKSLTDRYDLFDNVYQANQAKDELVDADVVRERSLTIEGTGHKLLELTDQGHAFLESHNIEVDRSGRGGIVHQYWQHQIKEACELSGWTAKVELFDADVYVNMDGKELAIEIAMGPNDREVEHAKQRLERGLDEVMVVCPDKSVIAELREKMEENDLPMKSIQFRRLRDFSDTAIFESDELAS